MNIPQNHQAQRIYSFGNHAPLDKYLKNVREWHGYIRFLGLPHLQDNPDVEIDRLYVDLRLARQAISPDRNPEDWPETDDVLTVLKSDQRLVILGDPGSGKSTLVNWLAWHFASAGDSSWKNALGQLVPFPMVLRELPIQEGITWDTLLDSFFNHPKAQVLKAEKSWVLKELFERGRALILLDGLDEIGRSAFRDALRQAVRDGLQRYSHCRWIFTSRVVGYDAVPFHEILGHRPRGSTKAETPSVPRYVAPFTNQQIEAFAHGWYALREKVGVIACERAKNLIASIHRHVSILRLARIPNLLTIMALIHRIRARLPHGRALLYGEITEAYLQSIDEFYFQGRIEVDYQLPQKKLWLALVGYEMQRRRGQERSDEAEAMLVAGDVVRGWVLKAMHASGRRADERTALEFVEYIGRRSGLLLPRGEDQYAFMHLSFQEYFAACQVVEDMTGPQGLRYDHARSRLTEYELRRFADDPAWHETLVFVFEMLAGRPGWPDKIAEILYGEAMARAGPGGDASYNGAVLLAALSVNPHSGFTDGMREQAIDVCCCLEVSRQARERVWSSRILSVLFTVEEKNLACRAWQAFIREAQKNRLVQLGLAGTFLTDASQIANLKELKFLNLSGTGITDITPLVAIQSLQSLNLSGTGITDITPLVAIQSLQSLNLSGTGITDITPLARLNALRYLDLSGTPITNIAPLKDLTALEDLDLSFTGVTTIAPVASLTSLSRLDLTGLVIDDLYKMRSQPDLEVIF